MRRGCVPGGLVFDSVWLSPVRAIIPSVDAAPVPLPGSAGASANGGGGQWSANGSNTWDVIGRKSSPWAKKESTIPEMGDHPSVIGDFRRAPLARSAPIVDTNGVSGHWRTLCPDPRPGRGKVICRVWAPVRLGRAVVGDAMPGLTVGARLRAPATQPPRSLRRAVFWPDSVEPGSCPHRLQVH